MIGVLATLVLELIGRMLAGSPQVAESKDAAAELSLRAEVADAQYANESLAAQLAEAQAKVSELEVEIELHETEKMARAAIHAMRKNLTLMRRSINTWSEAVEEARAEKASKAVNEEAAKVALGEKIATQKRKALDDLATRNMLLSTNATMHKRPSVGA